MDNTSEDGGFQVVPGFSHHLVEWAKETEKNLRHMYHSDQTFLPLPKDEPMQSLAVHVTCRAGSLIIWDQRTAHGSRPNKRSRTLPALLRFFFFPDRSCCVTFQLFLLKVDSFPVPNASFYKQTNKQTNVLLAIRLEWRRLSRCFRPYPWIQIAPRAEQMCCSKS